MQAAQEGLSHELTFSSCAETITCSQEACLFCKTRQFSDVGSYDKHAKESNLKKRNMSPKEGQLQTEIPPSDFLRAKGCWEEHIPPRSQSICDPLWGAELHVSPRTHLLEDVLEARWQMADGVWRGW